MIKRDISMIALVFFLTRSFFSLYTFTNIYNYIIIFLSILVSIIIIKNIKTDFLKSKFAKVIYLLILFMIFIIILNNTILFINMNYFKYNNYFVVLLSLLLITYILGKNGIKTIGSISEIFMVIFIIISIIICIGLISLIDIRNYNNYINFNKISINFIPALIIFILYYIKNNNIMIGYITGVISTFIDNFLLIGCLGTKIILTYKFPGISILKTLNFFNFINHLDKLFSFIYLFEYTITLSLIFFIFKDTIKRLKT